MTARILEAVPNFSEGRDIERVRAIVDAMAGQGVEVLDWSADPDHHRSVVTVIGPQAAVEEAAVSAARVAVQAIDLRQHSGVHPRVGALDVLPFVPLIGLDIQDARASARRVARRLVDEIGLPVYFYGEASDPPGRSLADLRRGGFEGLVGGYPATRAPDMQPADWPHPGAHPTAGATCVGARPLLLAWNVVLEDVALARATTIAGRIRERGGGFKGLRALALELPGQALIQISMNLEDLEATSPLAVFERIETLAAEAGGRVRDTEVIGMLPDELLLSAAASRLRGRDFDMRRVLSRRLAAHRGTDLEIDESLE